jgi:L-serine/L-threonine ammonia-lyase
MEAVGWNLTVPLITMETEGADCFNAALKAGQIVKLDAITSIASSLGALSVCQKLFELSTKSNKHKVNSIVVSDKEALDTCMDFAKDHRMLVEPACGAVLSAVYCKSELVFGGLQRDNKKPIVVVVCGGNMASLDLFQTWSQSLMDI